MKIALLTPAIVAVATAAFADIDTFDKAQLGTPPAGGGRRLRAR